MIYSILISLFGVFIIFLAPTIMLLIWNDEKITGKSTELNLPKKIPPHKDQQLVKEFKELS